MADKLLLTASFVTLTYLKVLPFWISAVVISRDVILVFGALLIYMLGGRIHPRPTWAGKAATFFQVLAVLTGLLARFFGSSRAPAGALDRRGVHDHLGTAVHRPGHAIPQRVLRRRAGRGLS